MSTREIAELTGKAHTNVIRDFREVCEALEIDQLSFESMYPDSYGRGQIQYSLPKDMALILVSGYSIPMRAKIIKRWLEIEDLISAPKEAALPTSYREAMMLAVERYEQLEEARVSQQKSEEAPRVFPRDDPPVAPSTVLG